MDLGWGTGFILSGIQREFSVLSLSGQGVFIEGFQYAEKRLSGVSLFLMDARLLPFETEFYVIGVFDVCSTSNRITLFSPKYSARPSQEEGLP